MSPTLELGGRDLEWKVNQDGRYEIEEPLKEVKLNDVNVFKVHDSDDENQKRALKVAPTKAKKYKDGFDKEVEIPKKIKKKFGAVKRVVEAERIPPINDELPAIVMPLAEFSNEEYRIQGRNRNFKDTLDFGIQTAEGLMEIHGVDEYHRDYKPINLLYFAGKGWFISDLADAASHNVSSFGHGNDLWWAPETYDTGTRKDKQTHTYNQKTDLYAWGLVFWANCRVDGRLPFEDLDEDEIWKLKKDMGKMKDMIFSPEGYLPGVTEEHMRLIMWCLQYDPGQRPRDAKHLLIALQDPKLVPDMSLESMFHSAVEEATSYITEGRKGAGALGNTPVTVIYGLRNVYDNQIVPYSKRLGKRKDISSLVKDVDRGIEELKARDDEIKEKEIARLKRLRGSMSDAEFRARRLTDFVPAAIDIMNFSTAWGWEQKNYDETTVSERTTDYARKWMGRG